MERCFIDATETVLPARDRYQPWKCNYRSAESVGRWGEGDGRRGQASTACRRSHPRQPSKNTPTTSPKRVLPRSVLPRTKDEGLTHRMGWRQRGLPSFLTSENNKTAAMKMIHNPVRRPRETRSKRRGWWDDARCDGRWTKDSDAKSAFQPNAAFHSKYAESPHVRWIGEKKTLQS